MARRVTVRKLGNEVLSTSLTSFTDFVLTSGLDKLAVARRILEQYRVGYQQRHDCYRRFREAVVHIHSQAKPVSRLTDGGFCVPPKNNHLNYQHLVRGYLRFWAQSYQEHIPHWTRPPKRSWSTGHLTVRVNPEIGFERDGETRYIKMYLKQQEPSVEQLQVVLYLMQVVLWTDEINPVVAVLDVRRGRLHEATSLDRRFEALLRGEALSLVGMCRLLDLESSDDID